jgi:predicted RNA-binding protein YlqC (UPF0109 family)
MGKDLIEYVVKALVDEPDAVSVAESQGDGTTALELRVAENDIGKVIGKHGRIAKALRSVLNASNGNSGRRYSLEILE